MTTSVLIVNLQNRIKNINLLEQLTKTVYNRKKQLNTFFFLKCTKKLIAKDLQQIYNIYYYYNIVIIEQQP